LRNERKARLGVKDVTIEFGSSPTATEKPKLGFWHSLLKFRIYPLVWIKSAIT
jgi:hypothetical protein